MAEPRNVSHEILSGQLNSLMDLYEHHLDLFWKWITVYVSIITATSAYIFNKDILPETKRLFPILIAVSSIVISFGCVIMWRWMKEVRDEVVRISAEINTFRYPSFLGIKMTMAVCTATVLFAIFNFAYAIWGI